MEPKGPFTQDHRPVPCEGSAQLGSVLLHLHPQSGLDLNQKFDVNVTLNASSVQLYRESICKVYTMGMSERSGKAYTVGISEQTLHGKRIQRGRLNIQGKRIQWGRLNIQ